MNSLKTRADRMLSTTLASLQHRINLSPFTKDFRGEGRKRVSTFFKPATAGSFCPKILSFLFFIQRYTFTKEMEMEIEIENVNRKLISKRCGNALLFYSPFIAKLESQQFAITRITDQIIAPEIL